MRAGLLQDLIEIYTPVVIVNEIGEEIQDLNLKVKTRARVIDNSGNRVIENGEITFSYTKSFKVRQYIQVDELDLVRFNGKDYRILSIEYSRKQQEKTINCELINE